MRRISVATLLYPPACCLCHCRIDSWDLVFCEACEAGMSKILPPVCQHCGMGLAGAYDANVVCQRCQRRTLSFEKARAPLVYIGVVREAIHEFKYRGRRRIGRWLAEHMARTAAHELPVSKIETVLPVPMHWLKLRLKGANPVAVLAQAVAKSIGTSCDLGSLRRTRWTPTQTRLDLPQRFRNVQGAFRVRRHRISDRTVLLVDDVLTSGATTHACALALKEAGAKAVFVLTAACAPPS